MTKSSKNTLYLCWRFIQSFCYLGIRVVFREDRAANAARLQRSFEHRSKQASLQRMRANMRIGDRIGIDLAADHKSGTTNCVTLVGMLLEKIDN